METPIFPISHWTAMGSGSGPQLASHSEKAISFRVWFGHPYSLGLAAGLQSVTLIFYGRKPQNLFSLVFLCQKTILNFSERKNRKLQDLESNPCLLAQTALLRPMGLLVRVEFDPTPLIVAVPQINKRAERGVSSSIWLCIPKALKQNRSLQVQYQRNKCVSFFGS